MANGEEKSRLELIRLIGGVIVEVDVLRSCFERDNGNRKALDNFRDELDTSQRIMVRSEINSGTEAFSSLTASLKSSNAELNKTIKDVLSVAQTLRSLTEVVKLVQKITGFRI